MLACHEALLPMWLVISLQGDLLLSCTWISRTDIFPTSEPLLRICLLGMYNGVGTLTCENDTSLWRFGCLPVIMTGCVSCCLETGIGKPYHSPRPLTAEGRVCARVNPCGIFGGQCGTGKGFSPISSVFPSQYISFYRRSPNSYHLGNA
jgi:hypothetical protein